MVGRPGYGDRMSRVAAIDCGTNSLRLLVADVITSFDGTPALRDLHREQRVVRLGKGVDATGVLDPEAAGTLLLTWARRGVVRFPVVGLLPRIWELRDNLSASDASYIALAEVLDCPLVTADARLARAPGPNCAMTVVRR